MLPTAEKSGDLCIKPFLKRGFVTESYLIFWNWVCWIKVWEYELLIGYRCSYISTGSVKLRVSEQNENLSVWSASMSSGLMWFQQGVHISALKEKSHSQGTADACIGSISIASWKRYGNLLSAPYANRWGIWKWEGKMYTFQYQRGSQTCGHGPLTGTGFICKSWEVCLMWGICNSSK